MQRVLLALDARGHADHAAAAVRTWMAQDSRLFTVMLYVTEIFTGRFPGPRLPMSYEIEVAQKIQKCMEQEIFRPWIERTEFLHKTGVSIPDVICGTAAAQACDTIVLGGGPVRNFRHWMRRTVPGTVLARTPLSVFVVRAASAPHVPPIPWRQARHGIGG